jgi:hypothetical protein
MSLSLDMMKKISEEIANDPDKLGYSGKTDSEVADILSSGYTTTITQISIVYHTSPINKILAFMSGSPNSITASEITEAKK